MRLSKAESGVTGSSGSAGESTVRDASWISRPPELHALVGHHKARDRDRRLRRERGDRLVELARLLLLAEYQLGKAGFVAQHHELHALLVADGVHPPAELDGLLHV